MRAIWAANLKDWFTGTIVTGKNCLDVNVTNTISTAAASFAYKERRFHDAALTTIPASTSNPVELNVLGAASPTALTNNASEIGINANVGAALEILVGATAGAAVAIGAVGAGQTKSFGVTLSSGNHVWVRAVQNATITTGELLVTFSG